MAEPVHVKVSRRYQVSLPRLARQRLNIQVGDSLLMDIQDGMLILLPQPQDIVEHLAGLHGEIWDNLDAAAYLREEREAWDSSQTD